MLRAAAINFVSAALLCSGTQLCVAAEANLHAAAPAAAATPQRAIKHNPFTRPDFSEHREPASVEESTAAPQALLRLRAVLYSLTTPLVNINGRILAEGDEIDGFLLQEVIEDGAILSKDDVQIMLSMTQE